MSPRLTILMPLKGRNLFTLRFLFHAQRMRMPYRFLVADGLVHPALADILEDSRKYFPDLDIEYIRYPDDKDFSHFFSKLADASGRMKTPYAMLADNDDFVLPAGLERAMDFLDANPDHIACSGRVLGFSVYAGLNNAGGGLRGRLNRLYMAYPFADSSQVDVTERLRRNELFVWPFYAVLRSEALAIVCRDAADASFSDLQIFETFHCMRMLTLGRTRMDGGFATCIRQYGTSLNASYKKDWVHHLVRSRFTRDIDAMVTRILQAAVAQGADAAVVRDILYGQLDRKFRQLVKATYGSLQEIKHVLRRRAPGLVRCYLNRPRLGVGAEEKARAGEMVRRGAAGDYILQFHAEIAELRDILSGAGYARFIKPFEEVFVKADATHRKASNLE